jgi:uncharacterized protein
MLAMDEGLVRVAVDDHVGVVAGEQLGGGRTADFVAVADVDLNSLHIEIDRRIEAGLGGIVDISPHRVHRRDASQAAEHGGSANVAGVQDQLDALECGDGLGAQQAVGIRDQANPHARPALQCAIMVCDVHCHCFSSRFLEILSQDLPDLPSTARALAVATKLGWDAPGSVESLADRWVAEFDRHGLARAVLIASISGDEESVATAVRRHPSRFVGSFMFNPTAADAPARLNRALGELGLRVVALFPAMHKYRLDDDRVQAVFTAAAAHRAAVFVHCGVLTVGVRKKLGLPSPFDLRLGDPLAVAAVALQHPRVPVIIPHFGAGFFREALMAADQCGTIHLDTSSSNSWMKYYPGLTLEAVFRQALAVAGPDRLLFGTDSSFFPRGWQKPIYDAQVAALDATGIAEDAPRAIFGGNFERLFPVR